MAQLVSFERLKMQAPITRKLSHSTGRTYNGLQVLVCEVVEGADEWTLVASFKDASRNLGGVVELIGYMIHDTDHALGKGILREYDAGRYHPL